MISFEQVLLLEEKVEGAVKKIEQLNAENAALRSKCAELSNALNAKTEQFSSFQNDQSKIEEGILKALSRLDTVENVVLQSVGAASAPAPQNPALAETVPAQTEQIPQDGLAEQVPAGEGGVDAEDSAIADEGLDFGSSEGAVSEGSAGFVPDEAGSQPGGDSASSEIQSSSFENDVADGGTQTETPRENGDAAQPDAGGGSLAPDIDFEFGESDVAAGPQGDGADDANPGTPPGNPGGSADSQAATNQPVFDIF